MNVLKEAATAAAQQEIFNSTALNKHPRTIKKGWDGDTQDTTQKSDVK